ncbi:helix-turn-helix domain-containing protein [Streptomyces sp. NPDC058459]|uniref:helix-turn-helix domain-containing protein n=1 Tax=Streptomyces sp. NPDC058459 TaxID=3346508 RepID=UPI0036620EC3
MATVHHWTGLETRALRLALRLSVRAFAEHLGVAVATVSKWESKRADTAPRPDTQAMLDTALARADASAHLRFEMLMAELTGPARHPARHVNDTGPRLWAYESWAEDLDRAGVALSRQKFAFADSLLSRWLVRFDVRELDDKGLYLFARSTALLGDLKRDQGRLLGPLSAQHSYAGARSVFVQLGIPRRIAQLDLSLAVVTEMSGELEIAARHYETLTDDDRLSRRDRARARLWVGTALSKKGRHDYATRVMRAAVRDFEDLAEPDDWSVAHQKIALARRGAGDLGQALHFIDVARGSGNTDSPMERVRLDTAHGHILLSDAATRDDGLRVLDQATRTAAQYGLVHQLRSIEGVKAMSEGPAGPSRR